MISLLKRHDEIESTHQNTPQGQNAVQWVLLVIAVFHVLVLALPVAHAATAKHSGPDAYGIERSVDNLSGEDIVFRGGLLALKAGEFAAARQSIELIARRGHAPSQYLLSTLYQMGLGGKTDVTRAIILKIQAARGELPVAQFDLGSTFFQLGAVGQAMAWWTKAAQTGFAPAQYNLGLVYLYGLGLEKDPDKASTWLMRAAASGSAKAQFYVGVMYLKGDGFGQSRRLGQHWISKSADNGYEGAAVDIDSLVASPVMPILIK